MTIDFNGDLRSMFRIQTGNTAATCAMPLQQALKKRFIWSFPTTRLLISLWEDYLPALCAQKHNAPIYCEVTEVQRDRE